MKNTARLCAVVALLCIALIAHAQDKKCGGWLEKCDTNGNGKITCAEAKACGLKTPIKKKSSSLQMHE